MLIRFLRLELGWQRLEKTKEITTSVGQYVS